MESYPDQRVQQFSGANMDIDLTSEKADIHWEQTSCPWNEAENTKEHKCAVKNTSICKYFCGIQYLDRVLCAYPHETPDALKTKETERPEDFGIEEMRGMQRALQEKYRDIWKPICPERGKDQLLWMIGEIGEVIDIVKKHGGETASEAPEVRERLVEELADVLMYYNDVLLCYGISAEELKRSYIAKFEKNLERW